MNDRMEDIKEGAVVPAFGIKRKSIISKIKEIRPFTKPRRKAVLLGESFVTDPWEINEGTKEYWDAKWNRRDGGSVDWRAAAEIFASYRKTVPEGFSWNLSRGTSMKSSSPAATHPPAPMESPS